MHVVKPILLISLVVALGCGCVRRVVDITSEPEGAVVWVNDREVGETPITVDFVHYGEFDVQVLKPGYEPITTGKEAKAPIWDLLGLDLLAELFPADLTSTNSWHFQLVVEERDGDSLLKRAEQMRSRLNEDEPGAE